MSAQGRIVLAVLAAAVLGGYWIVLIAPERRESAKVSAQIAQAQARRDAAVRAAATAEQARRAYRRDVATIARLGKAVPADDDVASLVFQVESVARRNRIDFRAVRLAADAAAAAAPATSAGKPADAAAADKTAATPAAPAVSQAPPGAVVGTAGLLTMPFSLTFDGGYLPTQRLLGAIDRLADATDGKLSVHGRLLTVDGFSLTAGRLGFPKVKAKVSATAYIVPPATGLEGAATPQPAAAPAKPGATTTTASIRGVGR